MDVDGKGGTKDNVGEALSVQRSMIKVRTVIELS